MRKEDMSRTTRGEALVNKNETIAMAKEEEGHLLEFEAEMRADSQIPDPRQTDPGDLRQIVFVIGLDNYAHNES